ncbi:MAG: PepSY-associated TM helix domain-containing protein [Pseudomonadota bacterium]
MTVGASTTLRDLDGAENPVDETRNQTASAKKRPPRKKKKKNKLRRLFDLHYWVGFHLAVVMVVVLFTGTFATISNELDWLTQHDMRVSPDGEKVSLDEMLDAVQAHEPNATVLGISEMMGDHFAYRVPVITDNATQDFIHVNQWTGEVTGRTPYFTIQRFFRDLHRYLFMPKSIGLTLVCSMAIILSISLYTGLKTTRNWRTVMTRIRVSKGARVAVTDAHKTFGLWSIWFFVLMITTGIWYYAEFLGKDFEPGRPDGVKNITQFADDVITNPSADEIVRIAQAAYPELKISSVNYSLTAGAPITVTGKAGNPIVRKRANAVYIDPVTLDVLDVRRSKDLPALQWTNQIADPLHFGDFGGLPVKLIWFVFGLFMTGLSVSGVWMTWKRLKSRGASRMQLAVLPVLVISAFFASLSFGLSKLPIFAGLNPIPYVLFIAGLFLAAFAALCMWWLRKRFQKGKVLTFKNSLIALLTLFLGAGAAHATLFQYPFKATPELALGTIQSGPIVAQLYLAQSDDLEFDGNARFLITSDALKGTLTETGRINLKRMTVELLKDGDVLDTGEKPIQKRIPFLAAAFPVYLALPSQQLAEATELRASFEMHSGSEYAVTWSLAE